jgi:hypothetical protein
MTERKTYLLVVLLFSVILKMQGNNINDNRFAESYIMGFSNIAVIEMERSGIPASIILAQGMLESNFGQSELASSYHNHFGIKCHKDWTGKSVQLKTNEFTKDGLKKENHCFRVYQNPEESFKDHTEFLSYRENYQFLFNSGNSNFKFWAQGLQKAKYATDPSYAKKIIELVEQYKLQNLDFKTNRLNFTKQTQTATFVSSENYSAANDSKIKNLEQRLNHIIQFQNELYEIQNQMKTELKEFIVLSNGKDNKLNYKLNEIDSVVKNSDAYLKSIQEDIITLNNNKYSKNSKTLFYPHQHLNAAAVFYLNGKMATILDSENNLRDIALKFNINHDKLLLFNDLNLKFHNVPGEGAYIFLESKSSIVHSLNKPHIIKENENMHYLSQLYGIKLEKLYKLNKMSSGEEPVAGEFIFFDRKVKRKPSVKTLNKH